MSAFAVHNHQSPNRITCDNQFTQQHLHKKKKKKKQAHWGHFCYWKFPVLAKVGHRILHLHLATPAWKQATLSSASQQGWAQLHFIAHLLMFFWKFKDSGSMSFARIVGDRWWIWWGDNVKLLIHLVPITDVNAAEQPQSETSQAGTGSGGSVNGPNCFRHSNGYVTNFTRIDTDPSPNLLLCFSTVANHRNNCNTHELSV